MSFFSFGSKLEQSPQNARLAADLDALVSKSISFRFDGQVHVIEAISTGALFEFQQGWEELKLAFNKKNSFKAEELIAAYAKVIGSVCPTITDKHVERMTQAQLSALFKLVMTTITGEAHAEPEQPKTEAETKKKTSRKRLKSVP